MQFLVCGVFLIRATLSMRVLGYVFLAVYALGGGLYFIMQDFLVDYSFLQSHSKHLFLRTELMYTHQWVSSFFLVCYRLKVLIICLDVLFCDGKFLLSCLH